MKNKIIGWVPVIIICLIIVVAIFESPALQHDFTRTQSKEFDTYFGEGNWEYETDLQDLFNCDYMKFQLDISCSIKDKEDYLFDTYLEEFKDMEKWLLEEYSDTLDFHRFLGVRDSDKEYRVDYINGVKEMEE